MSFFNNIGVQNDAVMAKVAEEVATMMREECNNIGGDCVQDTWKNISKMSTLDEIVDWIKKNYLAD